MVKAALSTLAPNRPESKNCCFVKVLDSSFLEALVLNTVKKMHKWKLRMNFYTDVRNTNSSKIGHTHDERYYTESEIDRRFTALTTGETLLSILKYLPSKYLDDPPKYLNLSGYDIEIYVSRSQVTISEIGYWACVLGVHDNNNGNLKGAQVAITTGATYQRSFTYQSGWTPWGRL